MKIEPNQCARLLQVARRSIRVCLPAGVAVPLPQRNWDEPLALQGASFVTLETGGRLRGCCGTVRARRMLVEDVWDNAQRTAFKDPRFPPLTSAETDDSILTLSVLSPLSPIKVESESHLLTQLQPGTDGVVISLGNRQATFLPKVWRLLPEPDRFVRHLRQKLGLPAGYWDKALRFERYETQEFSGALATTPSADCDSLPTMR